MRTAELCTLAYEHMNQCKYGTEASRAWIDVWFDCSNHHRETVMAVLLARIPLVNKVRKHIYERAIGLLLREG